jgi:prevent-host-death family protein
MPKTQRYGLEQARAQLPHIASEAMAGYASVITRHGKPVAAVVPVDRVLSPALAATHPGGILALRGTGQGLWPEGAARAVTELRDEWGQ